MQTPSGFVRTRISDDLSLRGKFIALEGLDGSGKTTQIALLHKWLKKQSYDVIPTKEPTEGLWGEKIKGVQKGDFEVDPLSLCFAYLADRVDHLQKLHLDSQRFEFPLILSDRYELSYLAYQQADTNKDVKWLLITHEGLPLPDLTIFLDVPPDECIVRMRRSRLPTPEKFEKSAEQLDMIRKGYFIAIKKMVENRQAIFVLDGTNTIELIHQKIIEIVSRVVLSR